MGKFLLRRFINYLILVSLAACVGYLLAASSLNPRNNFEGRNPPPPKAAVDRLLDDLNLNDETPIGERFGTWVSGVVTADFGKTVSNDPIWPEMKRRMGVSLRLLLIGSLIGVTGGVIAGVVCAVRQYRLADNFITLTSFLMLSTPVFFLAIMLKFGARQVNDAFSPEVLLYYTGETSPTAGSGFWTGMVDRIKHLILPTLAIVLGQVAAYSRYQRSTMLDVLGSDFLRTARAKGLRYRKALFKHGLRTAVIPLTTFFAYGFTLLITGAAFTEKLFGWHGMGEWFIDSVRRNDVNVVAAVVVFSAILILIAGMIADLAHAALDPRVRAR
ncbi:MAG: ABC transporter permease [Acidimicrobiia bacterium]